MTRLPFGDDWLSDLAFPLLKWLLLLFKWLLLLLLWLLWLRWPLLSVLLWIKAFELVLLFLSLRIISGDSLWCVDAGIAVTFKSAKRFSEKYDGLLTSHPVNHPKKLNRYKKIVFNEKKYFSIDKVLCNNDNATIFFIKKTSIQLTEKNWSKIE